MYDESVDDSLAALKIILNWFVSNKIIKKYFTALYGDKNILYFNECFGDGAYLIIVEWVFLIKILIILILMINLMKMILILLLLLSDF